MQKPNLFTRIFGPKPEERLTSFAPQKGVTISMLGGSKTAAGVKISPETAMAISTVYACISKISQTVAALDRNVYRHTDDSRELAPAHPAARVLSGMSDHLTTSFNFWEAITADSLMYGCGYGLVTRNGNGQAIALSHIPFHQVTEQKEVGKDPIYLYSEIDEHGRKSKARTRRLNVDDLIILPAFRGVSPIALHRETLGLAKAAEDFGASFFGSGGHLSGVLTVDSGLTDEQFQTLSQNWQAKYHGNNGAHATAILEHGIQYERIGIPPDQAQFIETRKVSAQEIARIFNVPAALIGLETNVTYSNVEQQSIFFATYTIAPLVKRIEAELNEKLFTRGERLSFKIDFDMGSLLRADAAARSEYFVKMLSHGVMSVNEVRKIEGLNPIKEGDQHVVQSGFVPMDALEDIHNASLATNQPNPSQTSEDENEDAEGTSNQPEENDEAKQ